MNSKNKNLSSFKPQCNFPIKNAYRKAMRGKICRKKWIYCENSIQIAPRKGETTINEYILAKSVSISMQILIEIWTKYVQVFNGIFLRNSD